MRCSRAPRRLPPPPSSPSPARAQLPPAAPLNDALIAAAKKEGKVSFYTAMDLDFAQRLGKAFEAKYGIATKVERSGAERVFQRIGQEHGAKIFAVDVANTADAAHCHHLEAQRLARCPICRRRSPSTTTRPTTTPMGSRS